IEKENLKQFHMITEKIEGIIKEREMIIVEVIEEMFMKDIERMNIMTDIGTIIEEMIIEEMMIIKEMMIIEETIIEEMVIEEMIDGEITKIIEEEIIEEMKEDTHLEKGKEIQKKEMIQVKGRIQEN